MTTVHTTTEDGVGQLVLSHPPLNILTRELLACLRTELRNLAAEPSIRVLLLSAEGDHFSAGADVSEHLPPDCDEMISEFLDTVAMIDTFALPVVAAVRGRCLGGGFELVQAADLVVAAEGATFGQPEITLGVYPPAACALLPDRFPPGVVAEMVLTGEPITAREAHRLGLVQHLVPDDRVMSHARTLAQRVARHSGAALRAAKRALRAGAATRHTSALRNAGKLYSDELMQTADALEGLRAFLEKREPTWSHQ